MITSCMCMYAGRGLSSPCNIHFINMGYPALPWPMIGLSSPVELMGLASPHFSLALQPQCYLQQAANGYSSHNWPHPFSHFGQHHESSARSSRPTISKWQLKANLSSTFPGILAAAVPCTQAAAILMHMDMKDSGPQHHVSLGAAILHCSMYLQASKWCFWVMLYLHNPCFMACLANQP